MFFRTIPKPLNWLAVVALVILVVKIFLLNKVPQPVAGMRDLGLVVEGLLASVIASYVFYLIVVHAKEISDKRVIYPHLAKWGRLVVGDCRTQMNELSRVSGIAFSFDDCTKEQLEAAFAKVDPRSDAPLLIAPDQYANWIQYFLYYKNRSQRYIEKVLSQLRFLDASLVAVLTKIDDCVHFNFVGAIVSQPVVNTNLKVFARSFFDYYIACKDLDEYLQRHMAA